MKKACVPVLAVALAFALAGSAMAAPGGQATQTVTYQVAPIHEIAVSGDPDPFVFNSATAGSDLSSQTATDDSTYDLTNNEAACKITGQLDSDMPSGMALKVSLEAPAGGSSQGLVTLSSTAADLVTGIGELTGTGLNISHEVDASVSAGVVGSTQRVITYTLLASAV